MEDVQSGALTPVRSTLGVVLVNYCSPDLTRQCVENLLRLGIARPQDIVVVDNASPDGSGPVLRHTLPAGVITLLSSRNGGFGAGVNLGVDALRTDLVLALNPDTRFPDNRIDAVCRLFDAQPTLGALGLNLRNTDGSSQHSARRFYGLADILARRTPLGNLSPFRRLERSHLMQGAWTGGPFEADWVIGGGFVLRRRAFEQVGCMDEGYFLYFEEVDLCARLWIHGWKVMAIPEVELIHDHQRASGSGLLSPSGKTHLRSMWRFFSKFGLPVFGRPTRKGMAQAYLRWNGGGHGLEDEIDPLHV